MSTTDRRLTLVAVDFLRTEKGKLEHGVQVNEHGLIIDMDGKVVRPQNLWSYVTRPAILCLSVPDRAE